MMIRKTTFIGLLFGGALGFGSSDISAQTFEAEYTTEWQTDFSGAYDWLNLLKTSAQIPLYKSLSIEASTISTAKTGDSQLIDDLLTYSNIEAGNIPLTIARMGVAVDVGEAQLFAGINNVNEDYFTSPLTSFFTNSSCGISPTISCNYDIANYPNASWCIHYTQRLKPFTLQSSLYPGRGYSRLLGHDNLFSLNFSRDGIFSISSIQYERNGIYSVLGVALHYGECLFDMEGKQIETAASAPEKKFSAAPWFLGEITLPCRLGLIAHGSFSTVGNGCKAYVGLGMIYNAEKIQPGVSFNYASFSTEKEYSAELSVKVPVLSERAYIQPAVHVVSTNRRAPKYVGMLRFNVSI